MVLACSNQWAPTLLLVQKPFTGAWQNPLCKSGRTLLTPMAYRIIWFCCALSIAARRLSIPLVDRPSVITIKIRLAFGLVLLTNSSRLGKTKEDSRWSQTKVEKSLVSLHSVYYSKTSCGVMVMITVKMLNRKWHHSQPLHKHVDSPCSVGTSS